jgi:hypothetical protein
VPEVPADDSMTWVFFRLVMGATTMAPALSMRNWLQQAVSVPCWTWSTRRVVSVSALTLQEVNNARSSAKANVTRSPWTQGTPPASPHGSCSIAIACQGRRVAPPMRWVSRTRYCNTTLAVSSAVVERSRRTRWRLNMANAESPAVVKMPAMADATATSRRV